MNRLFSSIRNWLNKFARTGLDSTIPEEEAKIVMIHNYLCVTSTLLLSPFPVIFWVLDLKEGFYLCAIGMVTIIQAYTMNYLQLFLASRIINLSIGVLMFLLGIVFYGFNAGFIYGLMALLVLPILYFKSWAMRGITYGVLMLETLIMCVLFYHNAPIYGEPSEAILLNLVFFFSCTILVISYFLGADWINRSYEENNKQLVQRLTTRNEELKNFSYSTSHDLKQPLRTILNFVTLFKKKKGDRLDEDERTFLNFIEEASIRLNSLIDALLEHSVLGQKELLESFESNDLVKEVISDLNYLVEKSNTTITIGKLPRIQANRQEVGAVFQNLISNAIKFRKPNLFPNIHIEAEVDPKFWKFLVRDNGQGIDKEIQDKIFQIFQKGHVNKNIKGTGIGLANCKKIVKLHDGNIWVESTPNEGSTFYFTIKKNP